MEIIRNVTEMAPDTRLVLEHMLGQALLDNQQVVVKVVGPITSDYSQANGRHANADEDELPEWCNVFEGLSDADVSAIEEVMLSRADLTRPAE
jgi:hypothetical protein